MKFLHDINDASMLVQDASHRLVSDTEKAAWNDKAKISDIPTKVSALTNDSDYVAQGASPNFANVQVPSFENLKINGSLNNKVIYTDVNQIAQAPIAPSLWHDHLAFCRVSVPTFETSVDGTAWANGTLDRRLFSHKENQAITVLNPTSTKAVRWTWNSSQLAWSSISWIILGITYVPTAPNMTVLIQSSADGIAWTKRHQSTYAQSSMPVWHYMNSLGGDNRLRITITHNSGGDVKLSTIRALTARWGDQGKGRELSFPYDWDENMNMTVLGQTLKVGEKIVATTDQIPSKTSQLTNDSGFLMGLPSHKHSVSDVYSLGETISGTVASVMQSHQSASVPHIYGGKFKWEFNSSTNSLDLVVI